MTLQQIAKPSFHAARWTRLSVGKRICDDLAGGPLPRVPCPRI